MVYDCEPVYFNFNGRTWLVEFWKGQYGITVGGEVGIYCADTIIPPKDISRTLFKSASDYEMLEATTSLKAFA